MKKVLFVASTAGHIKHFHTPYLETFKNHGYKVDVIAKNNREVYFCDTFYDTNINRSPLKKENIFAYIKIKKLISENGYEIIHCNTPVVAMLTRLAARKERKKGTRVIYTAHGFHFFKGAPLKNWLIYLPFEWLCSFLTDILITINTEDFEFAQKHLHAKRTEYVNGMGVDTEKFKNTEVDREKKRDELGIPKGSFVVLSVGELNDNKNHETVLRAIAKLERKDIGYVICGQGDKKEYLENLAKELGMEERLILLGYRTDVAEIYKCCDVFAFPSKREGLPVSVMEAMAAGLPCVVSDIRGNKDLIKTARNGYLCPAGDVGLFAQKILILADDKKLREEIGRNNIEDIKEFDISEIKKQLFSIYFEKER